MHITPENIFAIYTKFFTVSNYVYCVYNLQNLDFLRDE